VYAALQQEFQSASWTLNTTNSAQDEYANF
jgi:hypothetical protein